jgi:hypothetical protein
MLMSAMDGSIDKTQKRPTRSSSTLVILILGFPHVMQIATGTRPSGGIRNPPARV